jgi:hypothetical protein
MQHYARTLADRIKHDRAAELGQDLAHDADRFRFEAPEMPSLRPRGRKGVDNRAQIIILAGWPELSNSQELTNRELA